MASAARWLVGALVFACVASSSAGDQGRLVKLQGKVLTLTEALKLKAPALKFDIEPAAKQVVVLGDDGQITPLLSDETSRAFFMDERCAASAPSSRDGEFQAFRISKSSRQRLNGTAGSRRLNTFAMCVRLAFFTRRIVRVVKRR